MSLAWLGKANHNSKREWVSASLVLTVVSPPAFYIPPGRAMRVEPRVAAPRVTAACSQASK